MVLHNRRALLGFVAGLAVFAMTLQRLAPTRLRGEQPNVPSARTAESANETQMALWSKAHKKMVAEASVFSDEATSNSASTRLLLVGDSIFERLRGSSYGLESAKWSKLPALLKSQMQPLFTDPPLVLAIAGDQTQHVLWRLHHGELPETMRNDPQLTIALHIGTNNVPRGFSAEQIATGVVAILRNFLSRTVANVLVIGLLPRGGGGERLNKLCTEERRGCARDNTPYKSFRDLIKKANQVLAKRIESLSTKHAGRVLFVDCGNRFVQTEAGDPDGLLMPDALHPSDEGYEVLFSCLKGGFSELAKQVGNASGGGGFLMRRKKKKVNRNRPIPLLAQTQR